MRLTFDGRDINSRCAQPPPSNHKGPKTVARLTTNATYNRYALAGPRASTWPWQRLLQRLHWNGPQVSPLPRHTSNLPEGSYVYNRPTDTTLASLGHPSSCTSSPTRPPRPAWPLANGIPITRYVEDNRVASRIRIRPPHTAQTFIVCGSHAHTALCCNTDDVCHLPAPRISMKDQPRKTERAAQHLTSLGI